MLELHSNNHLNSLTLNEDTYEKSFEKTGVTENESYGCNSHVTRICLLILIDKCLPHALVFISYVVVLKSNEPKISVFFFSIN